MLASQTATNVRIQSVEYFAETTIQNQHYTPIKKIAQTLQGCIYSVSKGVGLNRTKYIIKVTNKLLHNKSMAVHNGKEIKVSENIIREASILKYLTCTAKPSSFVVKYVDFFCDEFNYFLVMEDGGEMSLFDFVKRCHQYINDKILAIKEWQYFCKMAMKQMVDAIDWMHNTMHCCHLDLSLENFVIGNVMVSEDEHSKKITFVPGFEIKIIDLGLSEVFNPIDFSCSKFVGKTQYKAPKVYEKKQVFDARCADCWSLSVVFFIMTFGCPPWLKPSICDPAFKLITNGHLQHLLMEWDKIEYITPDMFNLIRLLFQKEKYRLTIKEIKKHPFLL